MIYASHIQKGMLPVTKIIAEHFPESFILYKPRDIVSGDFYWLTSVGDKIFVAVADCTGHGVPGAILSVMCNAALNKSVQELGALDPGLILDKTAELLEQNFSKSEELPNDGMDIALCCIDKKNKQLKYAGANNPLYLIKNKEMLVIKPDKQPIGKFEQRKKYTTQVFEIAGDESIYLFSDGYADQFGGANEKKFMSKAFRELLFSIHAKAMNKQKDTLNEIFNDWKGKHQQTDDVCVMGIKL